MSEEGQNLRRNRLEAMGYPGFGNNPPLSPTDENAHDLIFSDANPVTPPPIERKIPKPSPLAERRESLELSRVRSAMQRTKKLVWMLAGALALSVSGNYTQHKSFEEQGVELRALNQGLVNAFHENNELKQKELKNNIGQLALSNADLMIAGEILKNIS